MDVLPYDVLYELVGWLSITDALSFTATCAYCHSVKEAAWKPRQAEKLGRSVRLRGRHALSLGPEGAPTLALPADWKVPRPAAPRQLVFGTGGLYEPFILCRINDAQTYCFFKTSGGKFVWFNDEGALDLGPCPYYPVSELGPGGWALTGGHDKNLGARNLRGKGWFSNADVGYEAALRRALNVPDEAIHWRLLTGCVVRARDEEQEFFVAGSCRHEGSYRQAEGNRAYYVGFMAYPALAEASFARLPDNPLECAWLPERQAALLLTSGGLYLARRGGEGAPEVMVVAKLPAPGFPPAQLSLRVGATKVVVVNHDGAVAVLSRTTLQPLYALDFCGLARAGPYGKVGRGGPNSGQVLLFPYLEAGTEDGARPDRLRVNAGPARGEGSYYHYVWDL